MQITMQGKYQTEDGRPVEILRTGLYYDGPFNVLGIIWQGDGKCIVEAWTPDGKTTHKGIYNNDLVPVPTLHHGYIIISKDESPAIYLQTVFHMHQKAEDCRLDAAYPEAWVVVPLNWES